jgi:hypothetical protein
MATVDFNFDGVNNFVQSLSQAGKRDFQRDLELFMKSLGTEFLRIVQDEIKQRKVVDTRLLLSSFQEGGDDNVWELKDGGHTLEVGTNVKYAAFVNDGHWTNPKGVETRFIPGRWEGQRFIYDKNADTGMVLKQKWVEGAHYWEGAIRIFEKLYPKLLEEKLQKWLNDYFSDFM